MGLKSVSKVAHGVKVTGMVGLSRVFGRGFGKALWTNWLEFYGIML